MRRLGLRGTKQNEVWAGKPVNMSAKLSSLANPNHVVVSERVFGQFEESSKLRKRALLWTCGCDRSTTGAGLNVPEGQTSFLWNKMPVTENIGLDFNFFHELGSKWCDIHGPEFCETIVTGRRPYT